MDDRVLDVAVVAGDPGAWSDEVLRFIIPTMTSVHRDPAVEAQRTHHLRVDPSLEDGVAEPLLLLLRQRRVGRSLTDHVFIPSGNLGNSTSKTW
jgi:hypothetical protein